MSVAVEVSGLVKSYGAVMALRGLDLKAEFGQVTAVLGANGAGKTTALEICEGFRTPDGGQVRVLQSSRPWRSDADHRARVGVLLQEGGIPPAVRVGEMLRYAAGGYRDPVPPSDIAAQLGLGPLLRRRFRELSGGQKRLTALGCAVIGRPQVLFLDEPSTGLDPAARRAVWDLVTGISNAGAAVVLTTHYLEEAEQLADQVVIVHDGRSLVADTPAVLMAGRNATRFRGPLDLPLAELSERLPAGVTVVADGPGEYRLVGAADPGTVAAVTSWCAARGFLPAGLGQAPSLESVFLELTGQELR